MELAFQVDERVLCFHGLLIYEAKVREYVAFSIYELTLLHR